MSENAEKTLRIGSCMPGNAESEWFQPFLDAGFEALSVNFHMEYYGVNIEQQGPRMKAAAAEKGVEITTLGVYSNPVQIKEHVRQLERAIDAAPLYGAKLVSTFAGAMEGQPMDAAFKRFGEVFRELCKRAEDKGVRIALENCPMGGTWQRATCNVAINPRAWEILFSEVPSDALGLEWEPAHQMIQLIDPIPQLRKWAPKVIHVHGKDASVDRRAIEDGGVLCDTDRYAPQRTVGFGDCDWRDILSILRANRYQGDVSVEGFHDPVYRGELEMAGQRHALRYLQWCRGGDRLP
ncbi:MAG: sugar phosphate isomerase/epimerase [Clostridiales bacterium]|nr:sugar phosphate isomerase/epimerase [Clostridiales bacterium]